jgi:hypothetical protein
VGDTHIRKRKLKVTPRKEKGKKPKVMDEALIGSDESTPSLDEGRCPPYQSSNLSTSVYSDNDDDGGGSEGQDVTKSYHCRLSSSQV